MLGLCVLAQSIGKINFQCQFVEKNFFNISETCV